MTLDKDNIRIPLGCLRNIQSFDLTSRREVKPEVSPKIVRFVRVECAGQIQPVILDAIDWSELLVTERIAGKLAQATRAAMVIAFSLSLKELQFTTTEKPS